MSDNKYVLPAKDFVSSDVAGHIPASLLGFEFIHRNHLRSLSRCAEQIILYHTSETPDLLYLRELRKLQLSYAW